MEQYLLDSIQIFINKAMRVIYNVGNSVKTEELQKQNNWLSVKQAAVYYNLMDARRMLTTKPPVYLYKKLSEAQLRHKERRNVYV